MALARPSIVLLRTSTRPLLHIAIPPLVLFPRIPKAFSTSRNLADNEERRSRSKFESLKKTLKHSPNVTSNVTIAWAKFAKEYEAKHGKYPSTKIQDEWTLNSVREQQLDARMHLVGRLKARGFTSEAAERIVRQGEDKALKFFWPIAITIVVGLAGVGWGAWQLGKYMLGPDPVLQAAKERKMSLEEELKGAGNQRIGRES